MERCFSIIFQSWSFWERREFRSVVICWRAATGSVEAESRVGACPSDRELCEGDEDIVEVSARLGQVGSRSGVSVGRAHTVGDDEYICVFVWLLEGWMKDG